MRRACLLLRSAVAPISSSRSCARRSVRLPPPTNMSFLGSVLLLSSDPSAFLVSRAGSFLIVCIDSRLRAPRRPAAPAEPPTPSSSSSSSHGGHSPLPSPRQPQQQAYVQQQQQQQQHLSTATSQPQQQLQQQGPPPLYLCQPFVKSTVITGNFKTLVTLPKYVDPNEWVGVNRALAALFPNNPPASPFAPLRAASSLSRGGPTPPSPSSTVSLPSARQRQRRRPAMDLRQAG